ncbi:MAG TPA: hypothetical protein V6C65_21765 [Allocoleopsis sp.]
MDKVNVQTPQSGQFMECLLGGDWGQQPVYQVGAFALKSSPQFWQF